MVAFYMFGTEAMYPKNCLNLIVAQYPTESPFAAAWDFYGGLTQKARPYLRLGTLPAAVKIVWCQKRRGTGRNTANDQLEISPASSLPQNVFRKIKKRRAVSLEKEQTISARGVLKQVIVRGGKL
ncbi:hypothetical protein CEXT_309721 [Caerostris extrusa]|uniref:LAGLIDADG homing endonuclease n=1 Tax=Caerostris extrusa TaxID=172846 RepID=A0AAV4NGG5_CAEEX|nr:hypothetical protein CEXT_309721 [Caerostris extrusa]